jgi:hypothetical protein
MVRTLKVAAQLYKSGDLLAVSHGSDRGSPLREVERAGLDCMGFYATRTARSEAKLLPAGLIMEAARNLGRHFGAVPDVSVVRALALDEPTLLAELLNSRSVPLLGESVRELAAYAQARGESAHPIVKDGAAHKSRSTLDYDVRVAARRRP